MFSSRSSSATQWGYNTPYQQVFDVLDVPANAMSASLPYSHPDDLQSQSMFAGRSGHDSALVHAKDADGAVSVAHNHHMTSLEQSLLQSSNNNSVVESSTSDEDVCTAPINCISVLGGGSRGSPLMAQKDFLRMRHPAQTSPREGQSSPTCGVSVGRNYVAAATVDITSGLKRSFDGDECVAGLMSREKAQAVFQDVGYGGYIAEAPSSAVVLGVSRPMDTTTYSTGDTAPPAPKSYSVGTFTPGSTSVDMDSLSGVLFLQASQPVPSLEEVAKSRPKRRNVRISKDPQSVAARHRRERISDRMRVLQRLVPGGTTMDTASMLDEAIHYVKFLKLQLQTLEQIGNVNKGSSTCTDAQLGPCGLPEAGAEELAAAQLLSYAPHLNCAAAFQASQILNVTNNNINVDYTTTSLQAPPQERVHSNQWA